MINIKKIIKFVVAIILCAIYSGCIMNKSDNNFEMPKEIVLSDGMRICAKTNNDNLCISSIGKTKRIITWEGKRRPLDLVPRKQRWHGLLGLVSPKQPYNLWQDKDEIIRVIMEEAQINYTSIEKAVDGLEFPGRPNGYNVVYNDDGLLVIWHKSILPEQKVLDLMVFQILVNGKKPISLPGSQNDDITVTFLNQW